MLYVCVHVCVCLCVVYMCVHMCSGVGNKVSFLTGENKTLFALICFGNLDQEGELGLTYGDWLLITAVSWCQV